LAPVRPLVQLLLMMEAEGDPIADKVPIKTREGGG